MSADARTGTPCPACGRVLDDAPGEDGVRYRRCWGCLRRECPLCGEWHDAMFFVYCHRCQRAVDAEGKES